MLKKGDKVGIVCCSNGQKQEYRDKVEGLMETFRLMGLQPVLSDCIYEREGVAAGTAKERAKCLMEFYKEEEIKVIFDISGGDIANEILSYIDFDSISQTQKELWGYSDLTTLLNAIYSKTGKTSVLYQVRNLISGDGEKQRLDFVASVLNEKPDLFDFSYRFIRGTKVNGVAVGGNIRCLLKLAGTEYFPDVTDKILVLEALGAKEPQLVTYFSQLQQMGVFNKVKGILLGTFSKYEENPEDLPIEELVLRYLPPHLPVVKTDKIGHGTDSKAIRIGGQIDLSDN